MVMSLHRALSIFVITVIVLAVGASVALSVLTTYLHRTTQAMEVGLHGVRVAQEIQIDLLMYSRTGSESKREDIESNLYRKLSQARQYMITPEEQQCLSQVARLLDLFFADARSGRSGENRTLQSASVLLTRLVEMKIADADASSRESERLDKLGDVIGYGDAAVLVIGAIGMLVWVRFVAFRPVFEIRDAMKHFASGQKDARVATHGAAELRSIAAQFNQMADDLVRQRHNQAAFLAAVAHDLRNPISALKMAADILSGPIISTDKLARLMSLVKRQVSSLDRMVGDLVDTAKIESGHLDLKIEELDARTIAQDSFNLFSSASNNHEFSLILPEAPVLVHCDRIRMEQVLNNLLSNAIKYSLGGCITLSLESSDDGGLFQVSDQGMGISQEDLSHIFEPFHRTQTAREGMPGVGLGLSVVQRIVLAHGGDIRVDSKIGKGTKFSVYIPAAIPLQKSA
jgi:signal transduction histidine kinase